MQITKLFRGKSIETNQWVFGTGITDFLNIYPDRIGKLYLWSDMSYSDGFGKGWVEIIPKSLGRFYESLGPLDIFENDRVQLIFHDGASFESVGFEPGGEFSGIIKYIDGCFFVVSDDKCMIPLYATRHLDGCQLKLLDESEEKNL
jgi:hypothetical protein